MQPAAITDDLVAIAAAGDQVNARQQLFDAFIPQVRIMIHARLNSTIMQGHLVDDLLQETMLALSEGVQRLERRTVAGLRAFASTIVSRRVADALRDQRRGPVAPNRTLGGPARSLDSAVQTDLSTAQPLWALLSMSGASPPSEANQSDLVQRTMTALAQMKEDHRTVLTLAFFDQLETRDIAVHLNVSRPAASMLLIRAIKTLRRNLTGCSQVITATHEYEK
jgi:RNA polymerase sigma factor (sigma-70 family)